MLAAAQDVQERGALPVPLHLRNAPTALMKALDYGKDYKYAHDYDDHLVEQRHLPDELQHKRYYAPSKSGYEKQIGERLELWQEKKRQRKR
jgi:putative ATPase